MTWARHRSHPDPADDSSWLAGVKAEEKERLDVQKGQAVLTVASNCRDARECAELLSMLGLEAGDARRAPAG